MPSQPLRFLLPTLFAGCLLLCFQAAFAMNMNLVYPYGDTCSPPQTAYLTFYSTQSDEMLFTPTRLRGNLPIEIVCHAGLRSVSLDWELRRNGLATPFLKGHAEALPANNFRIRIVPTALQPGFYDLHVTLDTGMPSDAKSPRPIVGGCTFGWRATEMAVRETRPADFKAFWDKAKARVRAIPLDAKDETPMETFDSDAIAKYNVKTACLPADYDPTGHRAEQVESCKVSFAGPDNGRVYGWLAKPLGQGPFPAMLVLPGAGFAARPRPLEHARHGYLALDIQIHGQDVDLPHYPTLPGYSSGQVWQPVDSYYYYNVHLRVLQALNYLASRPDVDKSRIVVVGGSQGGRLGLVAAGLDSRVTALVSCIANSPNYPYIAWAARCNGMKKPTDDVHGLGYHLGPKTDGMDLVGAPPAVTDADGTCLAYYDPMNFAPDIHCPVMMNSGLIDPISPPSSVWAAYGRVASKNKTMVPLPGLAHDWSPEFDRRAWRWLDAALKPKPASKAKAKTVTKRKPVPAGL